MGQPSATQSFLIKTGLGISGTLCLVVAVAMFVMGQVGSKSGHADNTVLFLVLVCLGLGCFIGIEWYSARISRVPLRRVAFEDDEKSPSPSPELMQALAAGMAAAQQEEMGEGDDVGSEAAGAPSTHSPGMNGGSGDGVSMNHLESADFIYTKLFELGSEEEVVALIQRSVADLQAKGYSDKGLSGFTSKLMSNLGKINPEQMPEQLVKNSRRAMQVVASLQGGGAAS